VKGFLFITTSGAKVSRKGNEIIVEIKGEKKRFPIGVVNHVFLIGAVNITASAIKFLSSRGRFVFLLNRFGKVVSVIYPEFLGSDNSTRAAQYFVFKDEAKKVEITRELLKRKLSFTCRTIQNLYYSRRLKPESLEEWENSVLASILSAKDIQSMLGIDGTITRYLYDKFSSFNESPFYFERREYYPPTDPINALLSLSFSIFYSLMHPVVIAAGFDPYFGFFHVKRGKHAALCSDVMEIARPRLSEFVFNLVNDGFLTESDFTYGKPGVYLKPEALKAFLKLYTDVIIHEGADLTFSPIKDFLSWLKGKVKDEVSNYL